MQILHQRRKTTTYTAPTTLSAIQAASQSPFVNAQLYSLVISRNANVNSHDPHEPQEIHFLRYNIIGHLKDLKYGPVLTCHTCHRKLNPSRETVPLKVNFCFVLKPETGCTWIDYKGFVIDFETRLKEKKLYSYFFEHSVLVFLFNIFVALMTSFLFLAKNIT